MSSVYKKHPKLSDIEDELIDNAPSLIPSTIRKGGIVYMINTLSDSKDNNGGNGGDESSSSSMSHFQKLEDKFRSLGYSWCDLSNHHHHQIDWYQSLVKAIEENPPLFPLPSPSDDDHDDYCDILPIVVFFFGYGVPGYIYLNEKFKLSYKKLMGAFNKSDMNDLFLFTNCHVKKKPPGMITLRPRQIDIWDATYFGVNIWDNNDDNGSFFTNSFLKTLACEEEKKGNTTTITTTTKINYIDFYDNLLDTMKEMNEKQIKYNLKTILCGWLRHPYL